MTSPTRRGGAPRSRRALPAALLLLLPLLPLAGCLDSEDEKEIPPPAPISREEESALRLNAAMTRDVSAADFPASVALWNEKLEAVADQSRKFKAVRKMAYSLKFADGETTGRLVFTTYPTAAAAEARFAALDQPPPDRKVTSCDPLAFSIGGLPAWGEIAREKYLNTTVKPELDVYIVRTSAAARVGRTIVVAQTITPTESPRAEAVGDAIETLQLAVKRALAVADQGPGAGAPATAAGPTAAGAADSATAPPATGVNH